MRYKSSVVLVLLILLLCLISYVVPSIKMENSENRTLATFDMVFHPEEESVVYHESPIERLDAALSDQFPFREIAVKKYLSIFNSSENRFYRIAKLFAGKRSDQYALQTVGNYELIEGTGYIISCPETEPIDSTVVQKRIEQIRRIHEDYPYIGIFMYYVTQATDMPWFNDYLGTEAADHYKEILDLIPDYVKTDHLVYQNLSDYENIHYKTDHHWNHRGARRGYENLYNLLNQYYDLGEIRMPEKENTVSETYNFVYLGSYGRSLGELYKDGYDSFYFFEYDLPQRELAVINPETLEEIEMSEIGLYDEYKKGEINKDIGTDHYIVMYGTAEDKNGKKYEDGTYPFIIRNSKGNGKNLLIAGDSYNRAMRDLLASHFDTTVYLDRRINSKVPIDYVIEKYDIDILLISSSSGMWGAEEYLFTFRGEE